MKLVYNIESSHDGSIVYTPIYGTCRTILTVGKPYGFEVEFNTELQYNEVLTTKDIGNMTLFLNFVEGVFATLEVLKNESI